MLLPLSPAPEPLLLAWAKLAQPLGLGFCKRSMEVAPLPLGRRQMLASGGRPQLGTSTSVDEACLGSSSQHPC